MHRFYPSIFTATMRDLWQVVSMLAYHEVDSGAAAPITADLREMAARALYYVIAQEREVVPISKSVKNKVERLHGRVVDPDSPIQAGELRTLIVSLHDDLLLDLADSWFLMVSAEQRPFYEQAEPAFGTAVEEQYPDASYDVAAASRCLALDEWTACVFHLMRALEVGLRDLARRVEVPMSETVELAQWRTLIDQIERRIREMESLRRNTDRSKTLQFYAEAAGHFWYFKEAWRNHVSHSRARYDSGEAASAWNHVRDFMTRLAQQPGPTP